MASNNKMNDFGKSVEEIRLLRKDVEGLGSRIDGYFSSLSQQKNGYHQLGTQHPSSLRRHLPFFIVHNRKIFYATPPLLGAIIWLSMMAYYYIWYLTLPRLNRNLPRIGPSYASWPFISCVGGVLLTSFQAFAIAVSTCNVTAFSLDLYLGRHVVPGRRWRIAKACSSFVSSVFLIALSFESVNVHNRLHLDFTSIQIICTGLARMLDGVQTHQMTRVSPHNRHIERTKLIKFYAALVAGPSSLLTVIGIYGCRDALVVVTPGTTCNILVDIAAPAEWILAASWALYMAAISFDLYHAESVREDLIHRSSTGNTLFPEAQDFDQTYLLQETRYKASHERPRSSSQASVASSVDAEDAAEHVMMRRGVNIDEAREVGQAAGGGPLFRSGGVAFTREMKY